MSFVEYNDLFELFKPPELTGLKQQLGKHTKVDTRDQSWSNTLPGAFAKYGFKLLGQGKYASVFGSSTYPFVIKVFMKDAAFLRWVRFAMDNQKNPYVPSIRGKVIKITNLFFAIRIEKLTPFNSSGNTFMNEYREWKRNPKEFVTADKAMKRVFDFFATNKDLMDLHSDNVMMSGKQPVVIDPFYNWFGKKTPGQYTIDPDVLDKTVF